MTICNLLKLKSQENTTTINLNNLLNSIKKEFNNEKIFFNNNGIKIELKGRPTALKRSFENIIQNGLTYGNKVHVIFKKEIKEFQI